MNQLSHRPSHVVRARLAKAMCFNHLAKTCPRQYRGAFYGYKNRQLAEAIAEHMSQFAVDSVLSRWPLILGITHRPTRWRFHVAADLMPGRVQVILHQLALANGLHYHLLRLGR